MLNYYNLHKHIAKYLQGLKNDRFETNKKQEAHEPHRSPEKKKSSNLDYIITLIRRKRKNIINFMRIYWFFIWRYLNPLHPKMLCAKII